MAGAEITQAIGRVRGQIRRFLCKEITDRDLEGLLCADGLEITLRAGGAEYTFRVPSATSLTPGQAQVLAEMPKLHAVDPPQQTPDALLITGFDVECLPAMLTELTGAGWLADFH